MSQKDLLDEEALAHGWLVSNPDHYGDVWYGRGAEWLQVRYSEDGRVKWGYTTGNRPLRIPGEPPGSRFEAAMNFLASGVGLRGRHG